MFRQTLLKILLFCLAFLFLLRNSNEVLTLAKQDSVVQNARVSIGDAFDSLFDTRRAPPAKSMGLLQGTFLDGIDSTQPLQLALVIDVSESMEDELSAIQSSLPNLLGDLDRLQDGSLEVALVTYADIGNKPIPATRQQNRFLPPAEMGSAIQSLKTVSGRPYFPEAVDLGLYEAINNLPWSGKPQSQRWIMLVGDAPPYQSSFFEKETGAKRWYETDVLVDLANQKQIKIHCLLCNSRQTEKDAFDLALPDTQSFMGRVSSSTGGLMLDLSFENIRQELAKSAKRNRSQHARIGQITEEEIRQARGLLDAPSAAEVGLRIAVLPFMSFDALDFFPNRPEVQSATELRSLLNRLPNTRMVNPRQIERQIIRLRSEGVSTEKWPQSLAFRLRADVVVAGQTKFAPNQTSSRIQLYTPNNATPVATLQILAKQEKLVQQLLSQLATNRIPHPSIAPLIARLKTSELVDAQPSSDVGFLARLTQESKSNLLGGLEALEQAVGFRSGERGGIELLRVAEKMLSSFEQSNPDEPFGSILLASTHFNIAQNREAAGDIESARKAITQSSNAIKRAYRIRNKITDQLTKLELEGDYHLLIRKEFATAIEKYQAIIKFSESSPLNRALRANWMLAGIRSGDWGVAKGAPELIDLAKARQHLIQILAHWPESTESQIVKRTLLWDDETNRTRNLFFAQISRSSCGNRSMNGSSSRVFQLS